MIARLKNIQKIVSKGRVYYYHRPTKKRINAAYGTAAFIAEVTKLNAALESAKPLPSTLGALMAAYRASGEFDAKATRTRADYQRVMDWLKAIDDTPLSDITPAFALALRDKAFRKRKRRFANYVVALGSILFAWGLPREITKTNPFAVVPMVPRPRETPKANRPWTPGELAAVIDAATPGIRAAVALGAYAGMREGDALRLPWSALDGGIISYHQGKTGDLVEVRAHRELARILEETPRRSPIIATGTRGAPMTENGFRAMFFRLIRKLEAEKKIGNGVTFHGLRHTAAAMLADAGSTDREIMAVTGHQTSAMVSIYTRQAANRKRAESAVTKLEKAQSRNRNCKTPAGKV